MRAGAASARAVPARGRPRRRRSRSAAAEPEQEAPLVREHAREVGGNDRVDPSAHAAARTCPLRRGPRRLAARSRTRRRPASPGPIQSPASQRFATPVTRPAGRPRSPPRAACGRSWSRRRRAGASGSPPPRASRAGRRRACARTPPPAPRVPAARRGRDSARPARAPRLRAPAAWRWRNAPRSTAADRCRARRGAWARAGARARGPGRRPARPRSSRWCARRTRGGRRRRAGSLLGSEREDHGVGSDRFAALEREPAHAPVVLHPVDPHAGAQLGAGCARRGRDGIHHALPAAVEIAHPRIQPEHELRDRRTGADPVGGVRVAGEPHHGLHHLADARRAHLACQERRERLAVQGLGVELRQAGQEAPELQLLRRPRAGRWTGATPRRRAGREAAPRGRRARPKSAACRPRDRCRARAARPSPRRPRRARADPC